MKWGGWRNVRDVGGFGDWDLGCVFGIWSLFCNFAKIRVLN
jgi:hypothetical protein